jgi:hypothetical protein
MPLNGHTRQTLITALKQHAAGTVGRINMKQFCDAVGTGHSVVLRYFPGGYREFLEAAGLGDRHSRARVVTRDMLMRELDRLAAAVGREPTQDDLERHGRIRPLTFERKVGCWKKVISTYRRWTSEAAVTDRPVPTSPLAGEVAAPAAGEGPTSPLAGEDAAPAAGEGATSTPNPPPRTQCDRPAVSPTQPDIIVGQPFGFRNLLHAPTTELGVVHVFGLLAPELNIAVEHIGPTYPDCRALRPEPGPGNRWRRIAIEFELRSSNFKHHRHDPALCDLIVCWEHDWAECPLEVLELRGVMRKVTTR